MVVIGAGLFLGSCCVWSFSSQVDWGKAPPPVAWSDYFMEERLPATLTLASMLVTLVGGMGIFAAGVGLYGERPTAGALAWIVTLSSALGYLGIAAVHAFRIGSWKSAVLPMLFAGLMTLLLPFAWRAAAIMRANPPPADQNRVTDDWLRENASQRRRERERKRDEV